MTKVVLFLAFLLVFSSVSAKPLFPRRLATGFTPTLEGANGPSVRGVVAQSGADYIVDTILPILTQRLTNIHLPDVNGGSTISYSLTNIVVQKVAIGAITTSMIVSPKVNVVDVSATITGDWSAQCCCVWKWCVTASGGVEVDISGSSLAISGDVTTTPDGHPQFTNVVVGTYINNMDVHVSGSLLSGLLDLIISAVKGRIRDAAQDSVSDALKSLVSVTANHILASLPVSIKVTDPFPLLIDFSLTENPTFAPAAPGYGSVSMHGCFQDPDNPQPAPLPHVPLPTGIPAAYMGEADIDQYIFNSGLLLQYQKSPVNVTVYNSDKEIPFKLVTDTFKAPIPPLYRTFPGYTVAWRFIQDSPFSLQITEKAADVTAVFNWTFLVSNDPNPDDHLKVYQEAFVLRTQFDLTAALNIVGTATLPAIHLFAAPTSVVLELASTNIGDFDTSLFQTFVQVVVGTLPLKLDRTVPLPVVDGAALVGPQVQYGVGFMSIFSNFSYTPPTALLTKLDALVLDSVSIDV